MATIKSGSTFKDTISKSTQVSWGHPNVYQMNPKTQPKDDTKITRLTIGEKKMNCVNKTVLFVGETGTGKSTLINALVNYTMGVTWEDDVWFKIVKGEEKSQDMSQTSDVVVYEVFGFEGQALPYSLTLIDTPGYGGTKGTKEDDIVTQRLCQLFEQAGGIKEISAVALVVKATENRVSDRMRYIFNSVMSLFGKDMEEHIILFITHSNGMAPTNVLAALKEADVKCGKNEKNQPIHFLFNNCQHEERTEENEDAMEFAFKTSRKGMMGLKNFLRANKPQNVEESMNVLRERIRLTACIQNLQERIEKITMKQTEIHDAQEAVRKCKKEGRDMVDIKESYIYEQPIKGGWWFFGVFYHGATRCTTCEENCHHPGCTLARSAEKCKVMTDGRCTSCTNKCPVSNHVKDEKIYVPKTRTVKKKIFDAEEKYGLNKCKKELEDLKAQKRCLLEEAFQHIVMLDEIALITNSLSTHVHLDGLIKVMKEEGYGDEAKKLEEVQKQLDKGLRAAMKYKLMDKVHTLESMMFK